MGSIDRMPGEGDYVRERVLRLGYSQRRPRGCNTPPGELEPPTKAWHRVRHVASAEYRARIHGYLLPPKPVLHDHDDVVTRCGVHLVRDRRDHPPFTRHVIEVVDRPAERVCRKCIGGVMTRGGFASQLERALEAATLLLPLLPAAERPTDAELRWDTARDLLARLSGQEKPAWWPLPAER